MDQRLAKPLGEGSATVEINQSNPVVALRQRQSQRGGERRLAAAALSGDEGGLDQRRAPRGRGSGCAPVSR